MKIGNLLTAGVASLALLALGSASASAAVVYQNDFEGGSTSGFTGTTTLTTAPSGITKFLAR